MPTDRPGSSDAKYGTNGDGIPGYEYYMLYLRYDTAYGICQWHCDIYVDTCGRTDMYYLC